MDEQELKSCPFCGNVPELWLRVYDTASSKTYGISCCVEMETDTTDREAAIAMWNTRVTQMTGLDLSGLELHHIEGVENGGYFLATDVIRLNTLAQQGLAPFVHAPFGYVINEFGDSVPAENAEEAARGIRTRAVEPEAPAGEVPAPQADIEEGDVFNIKDPDLHMLLNLSADLAMGNANQDTAMMWQDYLRRVEARLAPAAPATAGQNYPDHDLTDTERMVRTLRSEPTPEALQFYASLNPGGSPKTPGDD